MAAGGEQFDRMNADIYQQNAEKIDTILQNRLDIPCFRDIIKFTIKFCCREEFRREGMVEYEKEREASCP